MRSRSITVLLLLVLMFGISSESHAFLEWLHKLSGPGPFKGARLDFRFDCTKNSKLTLSSGSTGRRCRFLEWGLGGGRGLRKGAIPDWTVSIGPSYMTTMDNDLSYDDSAPDVAILSIEPAIQFWIVDDKIYTGFGYAFNRFKGRGFDDFSRNATVLRVGARHTFRGNGPRALEGGVKFLIFDEGFVPTDFGAIGTDRESRIVGGLFGMVYF